MRKWLTTGARGPLLCAIGGFVAVCVYLGLWVDPAVFYEHGGYFPAFQYGPEFLQPFLGRPGGPSQYVAAYLAQACANRWLGAGAFTALALLLGWGYGQYLRSAVGKPALPWGALAVLSALLVWTRYGFHLESITALTLALLIAAAYSHPRVGLLTARARTGLAIALLGLGYWLCGGVAFVAVLLGAACEHQRRQQARLSALLLLEGILIPVAAGHLYLALPLREAVTRLLPYSDTSRLEGGLSLCLLYGLAVLPALMLFLKRAVRAPVPPAEKAATAARRAKRAGTPRRWPARVGALAALVLVFAARPTATARRMTTMKYCRARDWDRVLTTAAKLPGDRFTLDTSYAVNLALYHTGRLGQSMFAFPQGPLSLNLGTAFASCSNRYYYSERPKAVFDIGLANLEMGLANEAEHLAHEALEIYGPHPAILKQLVFVNLVKGRPEAARVLLHALCLDPVARSWARNALATLAQSPALLLDGESLVGMRQNMPSSRDRSTAMMTLEARCLSQLEANPRNRMACEYLLAQYLVTHNLDGFIRELPRTREFDYPALPRHYQEAVLLYEAKTGREVPRWSSQVASEVREQFREFAAALAPSGGRSDSGQALAAAAAFRGTYFHHYVFRQAE